MSIRLDYTSENIRAWNALRLNQLDYTRSVSRLSTGLRINAAHDDPAGLAVGVKLAGQRRGWHQAGQNVQNAISLLNIADGGASLIHSALARIRELAVLAANDTYSTLDRQHAQDEVNELRCQIFAMVEETQFNKIPLLRGSGSPAAAAVDVSGVTNAAAAAVTGATVGGAYAVAVTAAAQRAAVLGNQPATPIVGPPSIMTINGPLGSATVSLMGAPSTWLPIINAQTGITGVTAVVTDSTTFLDDGTQVDPFDDNYLLLQSTTYGASASITAVTNKFVDSTGFTVTPTAGNGANLQGTINGAAFTGTGLTATAGPGSGGANGLSITFGPAPPVGPLGSAVVTVTPATIADLSLIIQNGPNMPETKRIVIPSFLGSYLAQTGPQTIGAIDITTQAGANSAIDVVDQAVEQVSAGRALVGAQVNGLESDLHLAATGETNHAAAQSRIMDADLAQETFSMVHNALMQQFGMNALEALHGSARMSLDLITASIGGGKPFLIRSAAN